MKCLILLAALLAPAAAQTTLTWEAESVVVDAAVTFPVALQVLDDGGGLTVDGVGPLDFSGAKPVAWRVARHGPNGALAWETVASVPASAPGGALPDYVADARSDGASIIALQTGTSATLVRHDASGMRAPDVVLQSPNASLRVQPAFVRADPNGEVTVGVLESNPFAPPSSYLAALMRLDAAGQVMWRYQMPASSAHFDDAGSGRVVVGFDGIGSPAPFVDVAIVDSSGVAVRTSSVDLAVSSGLVNVCHDIASDTTYLLAEAGSSGQRLAAVDASGALGWAAAYPERFFHGVTLDTASGWVWLRTVQSFSNSPRLAAFDAGGNLAAEVTDPAILGVLELAPRAGGGLLALGLVAAEPGLALIDLDSLGNVTRQQIFEFRPGQAVPRGGRAVALTTRGRRALANAAFRDQLSIVGPVDLVLQQALEGEAGQAYCAQVPNSTGEAARLVAAGSDVASENLVTLVADRLPVGSFGLFLTSQTQGFAPGAGGSLGTLCLGGTIGRFAGPGQVAAASTEGRLTLALDLGALPAATTFLPAVAGQSWNFQAWHRDVFGGAVSNFTNGVSVTWN